MNTEKLKPIKYTDGRPPCDFGLLFCIDLATKIRQGELSPEEIIEKSLSLRDTINHLNWPEPDKKNAIEWPFLAYYVGLHAHKGLLDSIVSRRGEIIDCQGQVKNFDDSSLKSDAEVVIKNVLQNLGLR